MGYSQGIDFRATSGFVTDPSGCDAEIGTTANYPRTTAQGNTVGWEQAPSGTRNRSAAVDARLAGIAFNSSSVSEIKYRLDVPNGTYVLTLAVGDATTTQDSVCHVYDDTTLLATIAGATTTGKLLLDATDTFRSTAADWVTNEQKITVTVTNGIFRIGILRGASASGCIVHLRLDQVVALIDTGLTVGDAIQKTATRFASDVGATISDSAAVSGVVSLSDTGATVTDSLRRTTAKSLADTGLATSDTITSRRSRRASDAGVTLSESVIVFSPRSPAISDTALTISDSLYKQASKVIPFAGQLPENGLNLSEGVLIQVNGAPPNSCTSSFRRFLLDLYASTEYGDWCTANPADCTAWTDYVAVILGGSNPSPTAPTMSDGFGTALVDAAIIALDGIIIPCRAKPPPTTAPHAAFSFAVSGLTVTFTNLSTPGASGLFDSWLWTFGDGDTDTVNWNPVHTYAGAGTYLVTLTIVGAGSDGISSVRHVVTVFVPAVGGIHIDAVAL